MTNKAIPNIVNPIALALGTTLFIRPAHAQPAQANAMMLAQANDRCMTTYAVRMTKADVADDAIFAAATEGCKELKAQLFGAIDKDYPSNQANGLKSQLDAAENPNFMNLLQKIRIDRLQRGGN